MPWAAALQASLSFTVSWRLLKLVSIESVMPSNHLILCCPLLLLTSIFPSIKVFSNELAVALVDKYWRFSFNISPSNEYSGLFSFRIDWFDLLTVQEILKNLLQQHSSKAPILLFLKFSATLLEIQCFQFFQISRFIILIVSWKSVVIIVFLVNPFCHTKQKRQCVLGFTQLSSWAILCVLAHVCQLRPQPGASFFFHCFSIWRKCYDSWQGIWLMFSTLLKWEDPSLLQSVMLKLVSTWLSQIYLNQMYLVKHCFG